MRLLQSCQITRGRLNPRRQYGLLILRKLEMVGYRNKAIRWGALASVLSLLLVSLFIDTSCRRGNKSGYTQSRVLRVANWEDYLAPGTLEEFTKRTGIAVELETFPDEDILLSQVQSDPARYDVIFPSRDRFCLLLKSKLLAPLPRESLTGREQIDPEYLKVPCDPNGAFFVPYLMGATGIGYNDKQFPNGVNSWRSLLDTKWASRAAFLNNSDEVLAIALRMMGLSVNATDPKDIFAAGEMLVNPVRASRGMLDPVQIRDGLANGELLIAQTYSGEALWAARKNPHVRFVLPVEGCVRWVDLMAIPAEAPHREAALQFLRYMLEPAVNAACARYLGYDTPNLAARRLLGEGTADGGGSGISLAEVQRCEFFDIDQSIRATRNEVWESLKNQ